MPLRPSFSCFESTQNVIDRVVFKKYRLIFPSKKKNDVIGLCNSDVFEFTVMACSKLSQGDVFETYRTNKQIYWSEIFEDDVLNWLKLFEKGKVVLCF